MEIYPALLSLSVNELEETLKKLIPFYCHFQIDVIDGEFLPKKTVDIEAIPEALKSLNSPTLKNLVFDFDLMVKDYESALDKIDDVQEFVKVDAVLIRASILKSYDKLVNLYPEIKIGLVIDPLDSVETIVQGLDLEKVPIIQIMTVFPGAQGNPFQEDMLNKIEQLRMTDYRNKIYLDGGISEKTLKVIHSKKYLPDIVSVGSYFTKAENPEKRIKSMKKFYL